MAEGYDHETLKQGLIDGKTGYVVFVSQTTGAYLYFYYEPLAINQWRLALSVPESTVFAGAATIRRMLNVFLTVEVVLFVVYLLWVLRLARKDTREKQRQLEAVSTTYNIERLLFTAHERRENLAKALEQIAGLTGAGRVVVWIDSPGAQDMTYLYLSSRPGVLRSNPTSTKTLCACFWNILKTATSALRPIPPASCTPSSPTAPRPTLRA